MSRKGGERALKGDPATGFRPFSRWLPEPSVLLADKRYNADRNRKTIEARDVLTQIPMRKSQKMRVGVDHSLYSLRNLVERCFNKLMIGSENLWPGRFHERVHVSTYQYARIVRDWVAAIGLEATAYGTHSMRRTKVTWIYKKTGNLRAVQLLLGSGLIANI